MGYGITAEQAMTKKPVSISPEKNLSDAGVLMLKEEVGSLVVLEKGKLSGIVTEKDLVRELAKNRRDPAKTKISEVMTRKVETISQDTDLYEVAKMMSKKDIRRMPVVDRNGKFLGLITEKDLLKIQPSIIDILMEKVELREPKAGTLAKDESKISGVCDSCGNYSDSLVRSKGEQICENCADELAEE